MLVIIGYHLSTHGFLGLAGMPAEELRFSASNFSLGVLFLQLFSWEGTLGNSLFILITGYFMINRDVPYKKILLLVITVFFYAWGIKALFILLGYPLNYGGNPKGLFLPMWFWYNNWFIQCYIMFFMLVPVINKALKSLSHDLFARMLLFLTLFYAIIPMTRGVDFYVARAMMFFYMYCVGSYIRLYPAGRLFSRKRNWKKISIALLVIILASVIAIAIAVVTTGRNQSYMAVAAFRNIAFFLAISVFLYFLYRKPFFNEYINILGASSLGVYLIHEHPVIMEWLAEEFLPLKDYVNSGMLPVVFIGKVLLVYLVCVIVEQIRKRFVEPVFSRVVDRNWDRISEWVLRRYNKLVEYI